MGKHYGSLVYRMKIEQGSRYIKLFPECTSTEDADDKYQEAIEKAPLIKCYIPGTNYTAIPDM